MSILIKNMELPTRCVDCKAFVCYQQYAGDGGDCFCGITKSDAEFGVRNADCPLIPVPPHGRTIDADALYAVMKKERDRIAKDYGDDDPFVRCLTKYAMSMVLSAPTILEAEEGE